MLRVSQLYIYPVKSLGGIVMDKARVTDRGFEYDRRWMLVDENNQFMSQRTFPLMALMKPAIVADGIRIDDQQNGASFVIPFHPEKNEYAEVTIWDDTCTGQFVSDDADAWFSAMLGIKCRLVFMPDQTQRITDQRYAPEKSITSFSDAYPFMVISQASLDDLNGRLEEQLPMDRFRPNIVFEGGIPYQEDTMHTFMINGITFYGVKLCARCIMPTINQDTAIKSKEPLRTLAGYRSKDHKILFGQNLAHKGMGEINVGDELSVSKLNYEDRFVLPVSR